MLIGKPCRKKAVKNCFELAERLADCGNESSKEFAKHKKTTITKIYNTDEREMRGFSYDEGSQIKRLYGNDSTVCHQLDLFCE